MSGIDPKNDFFAALPDAARMYAIPERYGRSEFIRTGAHGEAHRSVWSRLEDERDPRIVKVVSVYLGNASDVAAIRDGAPVDSSAGFSPAEGLPSLTASGDLDPTILFELYSDGLSIPELEELVTRRSGIRGYLGEPAGSPLDLLEFLSRRDQRALELREIFAYQIVKYIGGSIAVLGGLDALVFSGDRNAALCSFVDELCASLGFLGLAVGPSLPEAGSGWSEFSTAGSSARAFFLGRM